MFVRFLYVHDIEVEGFIVDIDFSVVVDPI